MVYIIDDLKFDYVLDCDGQSFEHLSFVLLVIS
jgi:hypothetical protein